MLADVEGKRKNSDLFIGLVQALAEFYPQAKVIHVVADNYIIHKSKKTVSALAKPNRRVQLHFLLTYSPEENPIERLWLDVHTCVTRNHDAKALDELMRRVDIFLGRLVESPECKRSLARTAS